MIVLSLVFFHFFFVIYPCSAVKIGLVGPKITLKPTQEVIDADLRDGVESCPNYVEVTTQKPIINKEKRNNINFGRNVLSSIKDEISSRTYSNLYDATNHKVTKAEKKREFLKGVRKKLIYFASAAASSSAATVGTVASLEMSARKPKNKVKDSIGARVHDDLSLISQTEFFDEAKALKSGSSDENIKNILISRELPYGIPIEMRDFSQHQYTDEELVEGAKLISASFKFLSSSVGLVADSVRVVGDTTAGVAGSTLKLAGKAVKSVSIGVNSVGSAIEGRDQHFKEQKRPLTSSLIGLEYDESQTKYRHNGSGYNGLLKSTRGVTGKAVRLLGSVVQGIGDSIVLVGSATETITSSTAGIAEDTVRVVEDFVGSLSDIFVPHQHHPDFKHSMHQTPKSTKYKSKRLKHNHDPTTENSGKRSYVRYEEKQDSDASIENPLPKENLEEKKGGISKRFESIYNMRNDLFQYIFSDVEGVPSFGYHILGVNILLYLTTILVIILPKTKQNQSKEETNPQDGNECNSSSLHGSNRSQSSLISFKNVRNASILRGESRFYSFFILLLAPIRMLLWILSSILNLLLSRHVFLLAVYIIAFFSLSRNSQLRTEDVRRKAEVNGFRKAMNTIRDPTSNMMESATWFNTLLDQVWRVDFPRYPGLPNVCPCLKSERDCICNDIKSYGGLEPLISSYIGEALIDAMESTPYMQPNDIAYVSLDSITLGNTSPLIRSVIVQNVEQNGEVVNLSLDVDAMLEDSNIILDIKLSNLDYALLPTTKLSINSLDVRTSLELSVTSSPLFPYISTLNVTMEKVPKYKFRVTPLSESSGLKGIDLASFPLLNSWIENAVDLSLMMYYVNPKYISIDMIEFFSGNKYDNCESYKHVDSSVREKRKTKRDRQAESLKQFKNTFSYDFDQISSQSLPKTSIPKTLSTDSNNADLMESTSAQTVHQADELKASTGDFLLKDSEKPTLFQNVGNQLFHFVTKAAPIAVATIVASIVFEGKKTVEKS